MKWRSLPCRFSLRLLCVLLLFACLLASWFGGKTRAGKRQAQAVTAICNTGSIVMYDHYFDRKGTFITGLTPSPPQPAWVRRLFGENTFAEVRSIEFGSAFTGDDIRHLRYILNFDRIDLSSRELTDLQMSHVARLSDLVSLNLSGNRELTGDGIAKLTSLRRLKGLNLSNCSRVTDAAIMKLETLDRLTSLNLSGCNAIAGQGLIELSMLKHLWLANCRNFRDPGANVVAKLEDLEFLSLSGTSISDKSIEQLTRLPNLRHLDITNCNITPVGLSVISEMHTLESLCLNGCGISLRDALEHLTRGGRDSLDVLRILGCLQGDSLSIRLPFHDDDLSLLQCANHVVCLELSSDTLSNEGLKHIATFSQVEELMLDSRQIDGGAVPHLLKLKSLNLLLLETASDFDELEEVLGKDAAADLKKEFPNLELW